MGIWPTIIGKQYWFPPNQLTANSDGRLLKRRKIGLIYASYLQLSNTSLEAQERGIMSSAAPVGSKLLAPNSCSKVLIAQ